MRSNFGWNIDAVVYDCFTGKVDRKIYAEVLSTLGQLDGFTVDDFGCGTGNLTRRFPETARVRAIDYSPIAVRKARRKTDGKVREFPLFTAHHFPNCQLPGVDSYIIAACYVNPRDTNAPYYVRAARTTANTLEVAGEHGVQSIAFPTFMAGDQDGRLDEIVPAMIDEFQRHLRTGTLPREITLFAYGKEAYDTVKSIADVKLR